MPKAITILPERLYSDQSIVTYRTLSRELGIKVDEAKSMLQNFFDTENAAGKALFATFVVIGTRRYSDGMEQRIMLVKHDKLEDHKRRLDHIESVHIYSVSPFDIEHPSSISAVGKWIAQDESLISMPPQEASEKYGYIRNIHAHRREGTVIKAQPAAQFGPNRDEKETKHEKPTNTPLSKGKIGNMFAKQSILKPKPATSETKEQVCSSVNSSPKPVSVSPPNKEYTGTDHVMIDYDAQIKREAELQDLDRLMEEDDAKVTPPELVVEKPPAEQPLENENNKEPEASVPRKRGRRKVIKQVTRKDEKGYLVTKEESLWESFSEGEEEKHAVSNTAKPLNKPSNPAKKARNKTSNKPQTTLNAYFKK